MLRNAFADWSCNFYAPLDKHSIAEPALIVLILLPSKAVSFSPCCIDSVVASEPENRRSWSSASIDKASKSDGGATTATCVASTERASTALLECWLVVTPKLSAFASSPGELCAAGTCTCKGENCAAGLFLTWDFKDECVLSEALVG